jgi:hypothetical protein
MKTFDFIATITSEQLNESMFKKFGTRVNFESYDREELEKYRNLLRTKIHQTESTSKFNDLLNNSKHQQDKHMLELLNTKIKEMLGEGAKVDRQAKHITKSMMKSHPGMSKDDAEGAAWAHIKHPKKSKKAEEGIEETTMNKTTEGKNIDQNKDGKNDWEDIKIARMKASGAMPKNAKVKEATKSSTGGTITQTKKGQIHTHNPDRFTDEPHTPPKSQAKDRSAADKAGDAPNAGPEDWKHGSVTRVKDGKKVSESQSCSNGHTKKTKGCNECSGMVWEALKGGRKKLDVNHNGKLEKDDFAALRAKKKSMKESRYKLHVRLVNESLRFLINEDEEGKAKAITSAGDMVNDFTTWMQRVGQYQTKSMVELADSIRGEFGQAESEAFKQAVAPALAATIDTLTTQREVLSHAVAVLAGEATAVPQMGTTPDMSTGSDMDAEMPMDMDSMNTPDDSFGASDAAAGGAETSGRETRESRQYARMRNLAESHSIMSKLSK